jgi:outer membrane protein assembly factor BamB
MAWALSPILDGAVALIAISIGQQTIAQTDTIVQDAPAQHSASWPNFRGPGANGHAGEADPPTDWSVDEDKNILWKTPLLKHGMSSPVVWDNRVFLTGADDLSRQVYCFSADTGELLWEHDVAGISGSPDDGKIPDVLDQTGFAAPTATTNGQYVAAIFATGELVCLSMTGERVWAKHLGIPKNHYGHASSLISHGNLLIVQYDQSEGSQLLAFQLASGDPAWQVMRTSISWSSPILVDNQGRMELILMNGKAVDSYDPNTGKLLWHVECLDGEVAPSAAYAAGVVFVASEYASLSAIDVGKHGAEPKLLWQWNEALPDAASLLANQRCVIVPTAFGVVSCLDPNTGNMLWQQEFGEGFYSSPILAGGRVYVSDISGTTRIFKMDREFELLGGGEIGEGAYL